MKKESVIILHGWRLFGDKYIKLKKLLEKKGYRVFSPDLPGFGKEKSPAKALDLDDYVNFVRNYIERKKISKAILIGHSFGGRIAMKLSARYPDFVKSLILTGVPGFVPVKKPKILFFLALSRLGKVIFSVPPFSFIENPARKILYRAAGATDYMHAEGAMRKTFISIIREDLTKVMKNIKVPTFLIWGKEDLTVPLSVAKRMKEKIGRSQIFIIEGSNHGLPYDSPKEFLKVMENNILL